MCVADQGFREVRAGDESVPAPGAAPGGLGRGLQPRRRHGGTAQAGGQVRYHPRRRYNVTVASVFKIMSHVHPRYSRRAKLRKLQFMFIV